MKKILFFIFFIVTVPAVAEKFCCGDNPDECCAQYGRIHCPDEGNTCRTRCLSTCPDGKCRNDEGKCIIGEVDAIAEKCCESLETGACQRLSGASVGSCSMLVSLLNGTSCAGENNCMSCQNGVCEAGTCPTKMQKCTLGADEWCCPVSNSCGAEVNVCCNGSDCCPAGSSYASLDHSTGEGHTYVSGGCCTDGKFSSIIPNMDSSSVCCPVGWSGFGSRGPNSYLGEERGCCPPDLSLIYSGLDTQCCTYGSTWGVCCQPGDNPQSTLFPNMSEGRCCPVGREAAYLDHNTGEGHTYVPNGCCDEGKYAFLLPNSNVSSVCCPIRWPGFGSRGPTSYLGEERGCCPPELKLIYSGLDTQCCTEGSTWGICCQPGDNPQATFFPNMSEGRCCPIGHEAAYLDHYTGDGGAYVPNGCCGEGKYAAVIPNMDSSTVCCPVGWLGFGSRGPNSYLGQERGCCPPELELVYLGTDTQCCLPGSTWDDCQQP